MNRNFRRDDEMRRNEGRWEPRMGRGERMSERGADWNERAFGEDWNRDEDWNERGMGMDRGYGYGSYGGRGAMERGFGGMERGGMGGERGFGYGGWGSERPYGSGERGYGMERGYGGERGYGERGFGERGYGMERGQYGGMGQYGRMGQYGGGMMDRNMDRGMMDRNMMDRGGMMDRERRMGRGPKNYQRSDERIKEDLCERLAQHDWVDSSEVDVQVHNGEVTLTGTVDHRQAKRTIEDLAEDIFGVKDVHNQLRVEHSRELQQQQGRTQQTTQQTKTNPKA
jgi:osmotically-inducible protein OsmY